MSEPAAIPASHADLLDLPVATMSTVGADGYPQTAALWFIVEDGRIKTSALATRQNVKNVLRHPKATWMFVNPANPYRTLEVRGDVAVEDDEDVAFMRREFVKYDTTPEEFGGPLEGRRVVVLTPTHVRAWG